MSGATPENGKTPAVTLRENSAAHLRELLLLPTAKEAQDAAAVNKQTFESVDVIAANELAITKRVSGLIKWGTGVGVAAPLGGLGVGAWKDWGDPVKAALLLAAAIVLAAGLLGLARVMDGDVRGRAAGTVAQLEARARVGEALISHTSREPNVATNDAAEATGMPDTGSQPTEEQVLAALGAYQDVDVTTDEGTHRVIGTRWGKSQGMELLLSQGDYVKVDRVTSFTAANPRKRRVM